VCSERRGASDLPTELLAAAVALTSSKLVLRVLGPSTEEESDPDGVEPAEGLGGFPGLPDPWSRDEG
jgi:hypothetical protein